MRAQLQTALKNSNTLVNRKGWKKVYRANTCPQRGLKMLVSDKVNFRTKKTAIREGIS